MAQGGTKTQKGREEGRDVSEKVLDLLHRGEARTVAIGDIDPNPWQPRVHMRGTAFNELKASIEKVGLIEVPSARAVDGRYQLAFGHRRFAAVKSLGWETMPLLIRHISDQNMALIALEENRRRKDLTPLEEARAIKKILDDFRLMRQTELGEKLGIAQETISNMLRVLALPDSILHLVDEDKLTFTDAKELLCLRGRDGHMHEKEMREAAKHRNDRYAGGTGGVKGGISSAVRGGHWRYDPHSRSPFGLLVHDPSRGYYLDPEEYKKLSPYAWHKVPGGEEYACDVPLFKRLNEEAKERTSEKARERAAEELRRAALHHQAQVVEQQPVPEAGEKPGKVVKKQPKAEKRKKTKVIPEGIQNDRVVTIQDPEVDTSHLGTRAVLIDLRTSESWGGGGEGINDYLLTQVVNPEECLKECTWGYHPVFNSLEPDKKLIPRCYNSKCLGQKRAALSRSKNAQKIALKSQEVQLINQAVKSSMEEGKLSGGRAQLLVVLAGLIGTWDFVHGDSGYYTGALDRELGEFVIRQFRAPEGSKLRDVVLAATEEDLARVVLRLSFERVRDDSPPERYRRRCNELLQGILGTLPPTPGRG